MTDADLTYRQTTRIASIVANAMKKARRTLRRDLSAYVPNTNQLYNAAFSGFLAGVYEAKDNTIANASSYGGVVAQAQVFAETVDALISPVTPYVGQATFLANLCQGIMANKYSLNVTDEEFVPYAAAIVALFMESYSSFYPEASGGSSGNAQTPVAPLLVTADPVPTTSAALLIPYGVDTSAGPFNFTLPTAPAAGTLVPIRDPKATLGTHSLTVKSLDATASIQDGNNPAVFNAGAVGTILSKAGQGAAFLYWPAPLNLWTIQ
jgi:hypothetical protein